MKFAVAFACLLAAAAASVSDEAYVRREFSLFEQKFGKVYSSHDEREARFQIFKVNLAEIQKHNLSGQTWTKDINRFTDMTAEEFRATLNGYVNTLKPSKPFEPKPFTARADLPEAWDWRDQGAVTAVKDQGACGSCWAFAAVEMLESYAFINNGTLVELSAQQLTSCTPNTLECGGGGGCAGGVPQQSFGYTQLFGIVTDEEMPYTSGNFGQTGDCLWDSETMEATAYTRGYELLPRNDMNAVMDHLVNVGPLSVAVAANEWSFYGGGVFEGCNVENNIQINHAVQLVGYGTDPEEGDYWTIRNSWGTGWGENGFMRIRRESSPLCGYDTTPLAGSACVNDGQDSQYVCGTCAILFDVVYPIGTYLA